MPLFGAHMSAAGGPHRALEAAAEHGMDACQLFTKNNQQWRAPELPPDTIAHFSSTLRRLGLKCALAHASYLINLATTNEALWRQSIDALADELRRADQLSLGYLVIHPGTASDEDEFRALERVALAIDIALRRIPNLKTRLCLETTAGQGRSIGHRFEHLATILAKAKRGKDVGICLDTCHVFAAGYALSSRREYLRLIAEFDLRIGLDRLAVLHLNDSVKGLGSRVDRHAHIGHGCIGLEGFRNLVRDKRLGKLPMILETPKGIGASRLSWDSINLKCLKDLCRR